MKKIILSISLTFLMVGLSFAGGFGLYEFGAAASSMGGATVARAWDASTVFYNPAGVAFLEGTQFYGGVTLISAKNKFVGALPLFDDTVHESEDAIHTPIGIHFTHQFNEDLSAGLAVTNPFGLGLAWDEETFPGRGIAFNSDLKSFYISPVVAYKLTDNFAASVGLDVVVGTVTLERSVYPWGTANSPGTEIGTSKIDGSSSPAIGFTAGLMYQAEDYGLGLSYRHSVENKLEDADATFEFFNTPLIGFGQNNLIDQKVNSSITFPSILTVGVYYKLMENLGIEVDYQFVTWSVFDELVFDFETLPELVVREDYEDANEFRVGVHYDITSDLQARVGYIYDQSPQPINSVSPLLPDNDRNDFSFGLGYTYDNWQFDAGYMYVDFGERSTLEDGVGQNENGFNGTYATIANLFFFSFGYNLQ
jgi:long-chain fatty acid transport protein